MRRDGFFTIRNDEGMRLSVATHGDRSKPALVLVNGIGCTERFWEDLLPGLKDFFVVEWVYRGHYDSDLAPEPGAYRVEDLAQDLEAVCRKLEIKEATFLGFSLGVMVVLEHYRLYSERYQGMVLVSGTPADPLNSLMGALPVRGVVARILDFGRRCPRIGGAFLRHGLDTPFASPLGKFLGFLGPETSEEVIREYLRRIGTLDPSAYLTMMRLMGEYRGCDVLSTIEIPALVISASRDMMAPREKMAAMRARIKGAQWLEIPDSSHTILLNHGPKVAQATASFMEGMGERG